MANYSSFEIKCPTHTPRKKHMWIYSRAAMAYKRLTMKKQIKHCVYLQLFSSNIRPDVHFRKERENKITEKEIAYKNREERKRKIRRWRPSPKGTGTERK